MRRLIAALLLGGCASQSPERGSIEWLHHVQYWEIRNGCAQSPEDCHLQTLRELRRQGTRLRSTPVRQRDL